LPGLLGLVGSGEYLPVLQEFEKSLLENGILPSSVIETKDEYLYKIDNLNVALAKHSYTKLY
jgi:hypothetical protein